MSYNIEIRLASKNGWHTPAQSRSYYDEYSRIGVLWHWWNSPNLVKDSDHDNIVNYILGKAQNGIGSINYVLSNTKITMLVNPDNVSWHVAAKKKPFPNANYIGVELSPHLNAEGYKKAGWLFNELEGRYGKKLLHSKHNDWVTTQCPGSIDINRIKAEAKKWKDGAYNPKPTPPKPVPVPPSEPNLTWHLWKEGEVEYVINKDTAMYDVNSKTWGGIKPHTAFKKGERVVIVGHIHNKALDRDYYITRYTFDKKNSTGFHPADLDVYVAPTDPVPEPPKNPPVEPTDPTPPAEPDRNAIIAFLEMLRNLISEFLGKFKK